MSDLIQDARAYDRALKKLRKENGMLLQEGTQVALENLIKLASGEPVTEEGPEPPAHVVSRACEVLARLGVGVKVEVSGSIEHTHEAGRSITDILNERLDRLAEAQRPHPIEQPPVIRGEIAAAPQIAATEETEA